MKFFLIILMIGIIILAYFFFRGGGGSRASRTIIGTFLIVLVFSMIFFSMIYERMDQLEGAREYRDKMEDFQENLQSEHGDQNQPTTENTTTNDTDDIIILTNDENTPLPSSEEEKLNQYEHEDDYDEMKELEEIERRIKGN